MGWREKISPKRAWNEVRVGCSIFVILGSYLIILSIHHLFFPWDRSDFIIYNATLTSTPKFEKSKSGPSVELKLNDAPNFEFVIDGDNYTVLKNKEDIKQLKFGDVVSVLIDKSQYNAKITKTISPSFIQRTINWKWIRVYEFRSGSQTFLQLEQVLQELKNVAKFYLIFGLVLWIGSYFYLKYEYKIYKKSKGKNTANTRLAQEPES